MERLWAEYHPDPVSSNYILDLIHDNQWEAVTRLVECRLKVGLTEVRVNAD